MNLRSRLLAVAVAITALIVVLLIGIVMRQRVILTDQIDDQLELVTNALVRRVDNQADPPTPSPSGEAIEATTSDMYIAAISQGGVLVVLAEPVPGPSITPDVDQALALARPLERDGSVVLEPATVQWAVGGGDVRAVTVDVGLGRTLIAARSMAPIDDAQNQIIVASGLAVLAIVAALGLAMWWVDRLGLQPISRLTSAAEEVAAGRSERRVVVSTSDNETGRLGAAFNAMLDARQESENRQRQFVADASHELRTPLTALRGYADLYFAGDLPTPDAVDDAMRRIRVEGARMAALTEDLLTLASLDEGRPLDFTDVDLSRLLVDIAADAAAIQPDRRVNSEGVCEGLVVRADRDLLTQAITAATVNALRHTPADAGLVVGASLGGGRDGGLDGDMVQINVSDQGPGIPKPQREHLFDRFYRGDAGRDSAKGGRGLGLSIAKTVLEAHGGTIAVRSNPGEGTTILLTLPVGRDEE
ncbi:MAG: ATP-binding protein [Acidimicrobiales bacterium]